MYNMRRNYRKETIKSILDARPDGFLVANKYKVLVGMLKRRHPVIRDLDYQLLINLVFDAVQGNREWQQLTEGYDVENKKKLEQEWKMDQGYHDFPPHVHNSQRDV